MSFLVEDDAEVVNAFTYVPRFGTELPLVWQNLALQGRQNERQPVETVSAIPVGYKVGNIVLGWFNKNKDRRNKYSFGNERKKDELAITPDIKLKDNTFVQLRKLSSVTETVWGGAQLLLVNDDNRFEEYNNVDALAKKLFMFRGNLQLSDITDAPTKPGQSKQIAKFRSDGDREEVLSKLRNTMFVVVGKPDSVNFKENDHTISHGIIKKSSYKEVFKFNKIGKRWVENTKNLYTLKVCCDAHFEIKLVTAYIVAMNVTSGPNPLWQALLEFGNSLKLEDKTKTLDNGKQINSIANRVFEIKTDISETVTNGLAVPGNIYIVVEDELNKTENESECLCMVFTQQPEPDVGLFRANRSLLREQFISSERGGYTESSHQPTSETGNEDSEGSPSIGGGMSDEEDSGGTIRENIERKRDPLINLWPSFDYDESFPFDESVHTVPDESEGSLTEINEHGRDDNSEHNGGSVAPQEPPTDVIVCKEKLVTLQVILSSSRAQQRQKSLIDLIKYTEDTSYTFDSPPSDPLIMKQAEPLIVGNMQSPMYERWELGDVENATNMKHAWLDVIRKIHDDLNGEHETRLRAVPDGDTYVKKGVYNTLSLISGTKSKPFKGTQRIHVWPLGWTKYIIDYRGQSWYLIKFNTVRNGGLTWFSYDFLLAICWDHVIHVRLRDEGIEAVMPSTLETMDSCPYIGWHRSNGGDRFDTVARAYPSFAVSNVCTRRNKTKANQYKVATCKARVFGCTNIFDSLLGDGIEGSTHVPIKDADHIVPLGRFGKDENWNIQTLCHACHTVKTLAYSDSFEFKTNQPVNLRTVAAYVLHAVCLYSMSQTGSTETDVISDDARKTILEMAGFDPAKIAEDKHGKRLDFRKHPTLGAVPPQFVPTAVLKDSGSSKDMLSEIPTHTECPTSDPLQTNDGQCLSLINEDRSWLEFYIKFFKLRFRSCLHAKARTFSWKEIIEMYSFKQESKNPLEVFCKKPDFSDVMADPPLYENGTIKSCKA